jgi:threonine synthase
LFFKYEGLNPTGSFKDRGMAVATAKAMEAGADTLLCASTGNTSASAAAYAAHHGLRALVLLPGGGVAKGKLAQAMAYGAQLVVIRGAFDDALRIVRALAELPGVAVVNSINPFRLEGQKTAGFEVVEQLGQGPDRVFLPVGNAGNITAYWRAFRELHDREGVPLPRMHGAQAQGAAPLVSGRPVARPRTVASAIRIGNPASWDGAIRARDESRGSIEAVTDSEILAAQRRLSVEEGLIAEPASAAALALLSRMVARREIAPSERIVCVLTGHGLKDPATLIRGLTLPEPIAPDVARIRRMVKGRRQKV